MTHLKERNLVAVILLYLFTFGIYSIYMHFAFSSEIIKEGERTGAETKPMSPIVAFILTFLTCGLFLFYYVYTLGQTLQQIAGKKGITTMEPIVYVLLNLVGIGNIFMVNDASTIAAAETASPVTEA